MNLYAEQVEVEKKSKKNNTQANNININNIKMKENEQKLGQNEQKLSQNEQKLSQNEQKLGQNEQKLSQNEQVSSLNQTTQELKSSTLIQENQEKQIKSLDKSHTQVSSVIATSHFSLEAINNNADNSSNSSSNTNEGCKNTDKTCNNKNNWCSNNSGSSFCKMFSCIKRFFTKQEEKVYILKLEGIIETKNKGAMSAEFLEKELTRIFTEEKKVKALCIVINSPGGSPVQSELIANAIIRLSAKYQIKTYTFIEDIAASGGYWLACAGDEIFASKSSLIGSIGVIYSGFGLQRAIEKLGIERRVYTSGSQKSFLDQFKDAKEEDIELIKNLQTVIHTNFINYVKMRRVSRLKTEDESIFTGKIWTGQDCMDLGLIDGFNNVYSFIEEKFPNAKIETIKSKESWMKKMFKIEDNFLANQINSILNDNKFM